MNSNTTSLFSLDEIDEALIAETLKEVYEAMEERGHNPINQLVGYVMSGDPGYISNHREARAKISKLDRTKIIDILVRHYFDKIL
ncbi:MAG: IreB family regulatory phosphoprotein [Bacilli bacterium]|nr:IreB family regulatory phosphoprotein [Bacilli bacterium]MDD4298410.1 IreB family regulatory phosphoprotein [Bacilli bacterium]